MPRPPGRPTKRTPELCEQIFQWLVGGGSLHRFCAQDDAPAEWTIYAWVREDDDFRALYERARELQADRFAAEIVELADDCTEDQAAVAKVRAQIDSRKWAAARMAPRRWGDRQEHHVGGLEGTALEIRWAQGPEEVPDAGN